MIWDTSDHVDYRVVGHTPRWRDMGDYETLEPRAGVYIFANANLQVKYVGKAGPGRMVVEITRAIRREKAYGATLVKALYANSDDEAKTLERDLIEKYKPPNNFTEPEEKAEWSLGDEPEWSLGDEPGGRK